MIKALQTGTDKEASQHFACVIPPLSSDTA